MSLSIFNYDNNLPGVITEIDSHLSSEYDTSLFGTTDGVCIIGTAFDGPVGLPTPVYSVEHGIYLFGSAYDSKTRHEASIVAGIQEAWNKGCRTIYAMRINGIDVYKDFEFATNTGLKLRIQSRYPSNIAKQCFIKYDNTNGSETITVYKPASRATINEKMNGLVESDTAMMSFEISLNLDYSYDKNSKLTDIIELVNNYDYNNVLEMEIVDEEGNVVTNSSAAYDITLGDLYPGVYFIGRGQSACACVTDISTNLVMDKNDNVPYSSFDKKYYRVLNINTDVSKEVPIYYTSLKQMRSILAEVGITMNKADDYLSVTEETNKAFPEDSVDYEETQMSAFEIYQRLGSGFATTAVAERRVDADGNELTPKIKESSVDDAQHIISTGEEGIYSILQDTSIKYHVLGHDICANTIIGGKLPKPEKFKTTVANSVDFMNGLITITRKVSSDDAYKPQKFNIRMAELKEVPVIKKSELYTEKVVQIVGYSTDKAEIEAVTNAKPGDKVILQADEVALYVANSEGVYEKASDEQYADKVYLAGKVPFKSSYEDGALKLELQAPDIGDKKYIMMEEDNNLFITDVNMDFANSTPFMATAEVALDSENDEDLFVYYQDHGMGDNYVVISYPYFATTSMSDYVELLNKSDLGDMFEFALTQKGQIAKDDYVTEADQAAAEEVGGTPALTLRNKVVMDEDRVRGYDYSLRLPYTTSDNFARHLAQHCIYTELKTYPTHGIIGCERVTDVSKASLAKFVAELKSFNWNMYVKNNYGRNMLNENNLPYSIGRAVTVTAFQENTTVDNFTAILNGASAYAGLVSSLDIGKSSTAQTIDLTPAYEFSRTQLQSLSSLGVVTVRNSFTKGYVVTDGVTMAPSDDLLRRLFNTRVMHYVEDLIRAACEPFIGTANNLANRNSLQTAIKSKLTELVDELLRSYDFTINSDDDVDQYTYIDINYTIVPMNEIREIRNYIRVQNS